LKETTPRELVAAGDAGAPLRRAVYGMLPKNNLRASRARKLRIFAGPDHPFAGDPRLAPWSPPPRAVRPKEAAPDLPPGFAPLNPAAFARRFRVPGPGGGSGDGEVVGGTGA
jgi:large subunit ribosomal protein L13